MDWETGFVGVLDALFVRHNDPIPEAGALLRLYAQFESTAHQGEYRTYREVLAQVTRDIATAYGASLMPGDDSLLAESICM